MYRKSFPHMKTVAPTIINMVANRPKATWNFEVAPLFVVVEVLLAEEEPAVPAWVTVWVAEATPEG